jgi:spore cortex biosynthesis protein YabQ
MEENIQVQIYIFLFTLFGGLIIGILYDVIDILLTNKTNKFKGRGKTDILFWMLAIIIILSILFYVNDGIIRFYNLLGFALGWLIYFWVFSKYVQRLIKFIILFISIIIRTIINIFLLPLRWLKRMLYIPYIKACRKTGNLLKRVGNYCKIPKIILYQFRKYKKYLERLGK